jgi:hypothetical protein
VNLIFEVSPGIFSMQLKSNLVIGVRSFFGGFKVANMSSLVVNTCASPISIIRYLVNTFIFLIWFPVCVVLNLCSRSEITPPVVQSVPIIVVNPGLSKNVTMHVLRNFKFSSGISVIGKMPPVFKYFVQVSKIYKCLCDNIASFIFEQNFAMVFKKVNFIFAAVGLHTTTISKYTKIGKANGECQI